jgi:translation elongation factor EF-1alpha
MENPQKMIGCLIVSCDPNEFSSGMINGQTKEDAILLKVSGISNLVILFNKIDLVDAAAIEKCKSELMEFINTLKFKNVTFCNVSGYYGTGLTEFLDEITRIHVEMKLGDMTVASIADLPVVTKQKIKCNVKLINCENKIVTSGFQCIMHWNDKTYQIELLRVVNKETKKVFARNNEVISCVIGTIDGKPMDIRITDRIVLREDTKTIGFGVIMGELGAPP